MLGFSILGVNKGIIETARQDYPCRRLNFLIEIIGHGINTAS